MQTVDVTVDAGRSIGTLPHNWNYIGYDECNYTYVPEGQELLHKFGSLEKPYYVRAHHMLCTGICHGFYKWGSTNVYLEDEQGNPIYDFTCIDRIVDTWLATGNKPFMELGFMPKDLADTRGAEQGGRYQIHGQHSDYQRIGWAMPPKDYGKWYDLIYALVTHCLQRYGEEEVKGWYWEMWNEPDIMYWKGTQEEFFKLYDFTEAAVHAAMPSAYLGGPATCGSSDPEGRATKYLDAFLSHCKNGRNAHSGAFGTRLDFITFHTKGGNYQMDALAKKQVPTIKMLVDNVRTQCAVIRKHGYQDREIVLSEADPDGWAAGGRFDNFNLNFRNTEYYASYVAAGYHQIDALAEELGMDIRPLAWAFLFVGERCFEGTRTFSTQGIDKAVLNTFRLFARLGNQRIDLTSSWGFGQNDAVRGPEINGWATMSEDALTVLLYCHHDDWDYKEESDVVLNIQNMPWEGQTTVEHYRIDAEHSNAYAQWVLEGSPDYPDEAQREAIKVRENLEFLEPKKMYNVSQGCVSLSFSVPSHAVSLLEIRRLR